MPRRKVLQKPWVKLWRAERGEFRLLPLVTRAIAAELLKIADDDGVIETLGKEPWEAVSWALGATRGDRRILKTALAELMECGYLVRSDDSIRIVKFSRWQSLGDNDRATTEQRPSNDRATTEQRPSNDRATKVNLTPRNH